MNQELPSILQEIISEKHREVATRSEITPVALLENIIVEQNDTPRDFYHALQKKREINQPAVIAEIKRASPSKGIINDNVNPAEIAKSYEAAGASCLSVLTDEPFFQGSDSDLDAAREATTLPVLRKDFIIDEYQVFEARAIGADCILLIAACLTHEQMYTLTRLAYDLGMGVLIEVHSVDELDKIAGLPVRMIGINNRDLNTFEVDIETTFNLALMIPEDTLIVTESGIATSEQIRLFLSADINAFLIGETLMREESPGDKLKLLLENA